jgi:RecA-family ATPase
MDAVLGSPDAGGIVRPTKLWTKFARLAGRIRPRLVIIDTLADVFGGDENVRTQARQFVGLLRGLAMHLDCAVLLLAHPSLSGMASGVGTSGSTGWNNSVRGRLYLTRPKEGAAARDANLRVLTTKKQNYSGGYGDEKIVRWEAGRFVLVEERVSIEADVEALFLELLDDFARQGRPDIYPQSGRGYICGAFSKTTKGEGTTVAAFQEAMEKLLERGEIKIIKRDGSTRSPSIVVKNVARADALAEFL